jgi:hypothetical protein
MKRNLTRLIANAVAVCAFGLSWAGAFAADSKLSEMRGTIKSVDADRHWLVVAEGKKKADQKFHWDDQTKFTGRGKAATATDLKAGERVRLTYTKGGDVPTLQQVHIMSPKTEKHTEAPHVSQPRS